mgnify:CR=1 FL=1
MAEDHKQPTLEELGLDEPARISSKISIERLQRESEIELMQPTREISSSRQRNIAIDIAAMLLSFFLPGAGHALKGKWLVGAIWFAAVLGGYFLFFWPGVVAQILCIGDAIMTDEAN